MLTENDLLAVASALKSHQQWTIVGHSIPDGDCIGAVTALTIALRNLNKDVSALLEDGVPAMYRFMEGTEYISTPDDNPKIYDAVIYLDCGDTGRIGDKSAALLGEPKIVLNIDHHVSNTCFGHHNLVDSRSSSTCEIVYKLLKEMQVPIELKIAVPLYCGIVMDTGSFQYQATSPETHRIAARLLEHGVDPALISEKLFESKSQQEIQVIKLALSSLTFDEQGRIGWMVLKYSDLDRLGLVESHFEGVINYARNVEGVELAILFREMSPGIFKVGFRSKRGGLDVNRLANYWGGGGHRQAAGAQIEGNLDQVVEQVLRCIKEELT